MSPLRGRSHRIPQDCDCKLMKTICLLLIALHALGSSCRYAIADETSTADESEVLFTRRIAPLFREKCLGCHGQDVEKNSAKVALISDLSVIDGRRR